jgi:hypothetical protein
MLVNSSGTKELPAATPAAAVSSRTRSPAAVQLLTPGAGLLAVPLGLAAPLAVPLAPLLAVPLALAAPLALAVTPVPAPGAAAEPHPASAAAPAAASAAATDGASRYRASGCRRWRGRYQCRGSQLLGKRLLIAPLLAAGETGPPSVRRSRAGPGLFGGAAGPGPPGRYGPFAPDLTT